MKVKDLMTKNVATVRPGDPASAALNTMWDCDCGALPVIDDEGRAVAIVTDRDIAMTALFRDLPPSALSVSDAMSKSIQSCALDDTIASAEEIMRAHQIRRLAVIDSERRLVGVLSMADIVRSAAAKGQRKGIAANEVTEMMADICSPRSTRQASART